MGRFRCRAVVADILLPRGTGRADRPTIDSGGGHGEKELAVETVIPGQSSAFTGFLVK
jgi:hypothetical protein